MKKQKTILIVDFGGQYSHLIARRVRNLGAYCEITPFTKADEAAKALAPVGIILTGGPRSVYGEGAASASRALLDSGVPVLGICYGAQLLIHTFGGRVARATQPEYGQTLTSFRTDCRLFDGIPSSGTTWMSHTDEIVELPEGFEAIASTPNCKNGAAAHATKPLYAVQFHPEVEHTPCGNAILKNFLHRICGMECDFSMSDYATQAIEDVKKQVGKGKVILGLSGGVDSSVVAALLGKAIGKQLTCVFVDHGLMRADEGDQIEEIFGKGDINFVRINAEDRFLAALHNVVEPEQKRKIIGAEFIRIFEEQAALVKADFLAQGTIYPDIIESGVGDAAVIKSHHNVGGLPDTMDFKGLVEPLKMLFKDEVRALGRVLGLPGYLVDRQPFPGPGLGVRCIGALTKKRLDVLRHADKILREEIDQAGLAPSINQYFAVLTNMQSVGVMGDNRTYNDVIALRAVTTTDFMTADFARIPYELLAKISARICNEVKGAGRVVYDITTKPPGTIEWE